LEHARADVEVKEAALEVAKKDRDQVKALLAYATLTAPYKGVVTRRNINRGDFVQPATAGQGAPLFVVQRTDLMRVFVTVPEGDADWVKPAAKGQAATEAVIHVEALRGKEFSGPVVRTSWSLDPKERTLLAEIDLPNPNGEDSSGELRPGMYVHATLKGVRAAAWTLPVSAVVIKRDQTVGDQTFCYMLGEDGKAVKTPLKAGARDAQRVEALAKQTKEDGPWQAVTGQETVVEDPSKLTQEQAPSPAAK
jgi:RND family efflux transporter MFP subunit